jgi:DNA processing protein
MPADPQPDIRDLLRLTLTPGLGPILIARLLEALGSARAVLAASAADLQRIRGIGDAKSTTIFRGLKESADKVSEELALAEKLGVRLIPKDSPDYPPLLRTIPDAPPLLYVRGSLRPQDADAYPVAIVGSRNATAYGIEQAERFGGVLARSGLTIVSGGARGVDSAAHRGAMRSAGRTIAVLGCGLAECYPPENRELFDRIVATDAGAIVSELPLRAPPESDNFPARNRLISGISLGVIVIEAGRKSGSLITARIALEDHNREVMAVPGRVDSAASQGTHELLKKHGAALVTEPGDVLETLETPARHSFQGTHEARYADPAKPTDSLFEPKAPAPKSLALTPAQQAILAALETPATLDEIARDTGLAPGALRAELTLLELQKRVSRRGSQISRTQTPSETGFASP